MILVSANGLGRQYSGDPIFQDLKFEVRAGERIGLVGPNGAGKTTLVKILLGDIAPDAGTVTLGSNLEIAYVDQTRADLAEAQTLTQVLVPHGGDQIMVQGKPRHVAAYAKDFLFRDDQLRQPVKSLSGGERNRLLLARTLAKPSNLMILDEPTNDLDMETLDLLEDMLADYAGTLLLVSHDRDFIDRLATSTIALDGQGRVVETPGGWTDFLTQNPGFLEGEGAPPATSAPASPSVRSAPAKTKLSFKDSHRLGVLEARLPELGAQIAAFEATLADPNLYRRDPAAFEAATRALADARAELEHSETEWLILAEKADSL
jgi:ATP-binding cassette subfamily F protein uup